MEDPAPYGPSPVFKNFHALEDESYISLVHYFEENYGEIQTLPIREYIQVLDQYLCALFQLGDYAQFVYKCEEFLILSIRHNVVWIKGRNAYRNILLKKAASHFHLQKTDEANKVLDELLKMDPGNPTYRLLKSKCISREKGNIKKTTRAIFVLGVMITTLLIAMELFFIRPFLPDLKFQFSLGRNIFFFASLLVLLAGELTQLLLNKYRLMYKIEELQLRRRKKS